MLLTKEDLDPNLLGGDGLTALEWAAWGRRIQILKLLLQRKDIKVNTDNQEKQSAFSFAASQGHGDVVRLLLQHRVINPNKICGTSTVLLYLASIGCLEIINILLEDL